MFAKFSMGAEEKPEEPEPPEQLLSELTLKGVAEYILSDKCKCIDYIIDYILKTQNWHLWIFSFKKTCGVDAVDGLDNEQIDTAKIRRKSIRDIN